MGMNVNVGGSWKEGKPFINVSGSWKPVEAAWTNVGGTWKEFFKAQYVHNIVNDSASINLDEIVTAAGDNKEIVVHIHSGVKVKSSGSYGGAYITKLPSGKKLTLINDGAIYGKGGAGGAGSKVTNFNDVYFNTDVAGKGGQGHPGLSIPKPLAGTFELINNGAIYGGGGGGGGGGAGVLPFQVVEDTPLNHAITGAGGGGGQSSVVTEGGDSGAAYTYPNPRKLFITRGKAGQQGGFTGQGAGGASNPRIGNLKNGKGGNGGSWGQPGGTGDRGIAYKTGQYQQGATGGAAGASIDGISRITITKRGTLVGPTKN